MPKSTQLKDANEHTSLDTCLALFFLKNSLQHLKNLTAQSSLLRAATWKSSYLSVSTSGNRSIPLCPSSRVSLLSYASLIEDATRRIVLAVGDSSLRRFRGAPRLTRKLLSRPLSCIRGRLTEMIKGCLEAGAETRLAFQDKECNQDRDE
ncbi:hypothetical protein L6452_19091 [Arctium lappa]|uniref:Uncharacterized protein n=1 Tax=Arctium lappa TaxID=4217 RepID=A0ACB9B6Y2_ARCLA|nr:hypothetical protein L6452_19091 [Arctium lappa]